MKDGDEPVRLSALYVVVVEARNLRAPHVAPSTPAEDAPFERLEPAIGEVLPPPAPRHPEEVEVGVREREGDAMVRGPIVKKRRIEGLTVERDERVEIAREPGQLVEECPLLRVVAREELAEDDVPLDDEAEPHEEDRRSREAAGLDVEIEEPAVAEAPEKPPFGRIDGRGHGGQIGGLPHETRLFDARPVAGAATLVAVARGGGLVCVRVTDPTVELGDSTDERHRPLSKVGVEPLVDEDGARLVRHHPPGENVLDGDGQNGALSDQSATILGAWRRLSGRRPPRWRVLTEEIADLRTKRLGEH